MSHSNPRIRSIFFPCYEAEKNCKRHSSGLPSCQSNEACSPSIAWAGPTDGQSNSGALIKTPAPFLGTPFSRQSNRSLTMNTSNSSREVIVTGIHLDLTPSLKNYVQEKVERLFRHETHIVRMRLELECDRTHDVGHKFVAKIHVE